MGFGFTLGLWQLISIVVTVAIVWLIVRFLYNYGKDRSNE